MEKIPTFSNFGKNTNDFFTKGFPSAHKVDVSTKAENGLTFTSSAEKKENKDGSSYILSKVEGKYKCSCVSGSWDLTSSVDTDNVIKGDLGVTHPKVPGLKLSFKPQVGKAWDFNSGFEFQNPNLSATSSILFKRTGGVIFSGTLVGGRNGASVGVESVYSFLRDKETKQAPGLDVVKGLVNYRTGGLDITAFVKTEFSVVEKEGSSTPAQKIILGGAYEHKPSDSTVLHSTLEYDTSKTLKDTLACTFGASYKVDSETLTKAKFNNEGKLTLYASKQLTPRVSGSLTSEFDTFNLGGNAQKFAFGLSYKA